MSNLHISPEIWLKEMFEYEYCAECAGDAEHHTAVPFVGNWFARCEDVKKFRRVKSKHSKGSPLCGHQTF
jgi:hypothetical protein